MANFYLRQNVKTSEAVASALIKFEQLSFECVFGFTFNNENS